MQAYKRLISYVYGHLGILTLAFVFMFLTALFEASPLTMVIPLVDRIMADKLVVLPDYANTPGFITDLVDKINSLPRLSILLFVIAVGFVMTVLRSIFEYLYSFLMNDASHRVIRDLRAQVYEKLIHLSLGFFSRQRAGSLVSRITYDTGVIRDAISEGLKDLLFQPIQLVAHLIILLAIRHVFQIPWSFIFIIVLVLPLVVVPIIQLGKKLRKISFESQERMAGLHSSLYESLSGIRVVQAFGMEGYEKKRFADHNWGYYRTMMASIARTLMIRPITAIVIALCAAAVAWMGGNEIVHRGMSPGALLAFLAALFSLFRPFKRLSRLHGINQTALAAADRIFNVLDAPADIKEVPEPIYLPKLNEKIEYKNVSFAYEPGHDILRSIDISIKKGDIVAFVGPSGAGKTTLLNLLPRFYDPQKGNIVIDGRDIRKAKLESLRSQIGIVTQETILFNDTVSANIAYGKSNVSHDRVIEASKAANAHNFIQKLPKGYQTVVGDRGFKLSGGEKQRVAIARAVFKNPPILILDEATSALDSESERLVQSAIHNLMKGRTVLAIAHRLSTIQHASFIVVLDGGRMVAKGPHADLLSQDGFYRKIYKMQFEGVV